MLEDVTEVLDEALQLGDKLKAMDASTALLGSVPEFDSMAVVTVLTLLEERYGFVIEDDEVSAEIFATLGTLSDFVEAKLHNGG